MGWWVFARQSQTLHHGVHATESSVPNGQRRLASDVTTNVCCLSHRTLSRHDVWEESDQRHTPAQREVDIFSNSITGNDDGAIHHHRQHFNNSDFNVALPEEVDLQGMEVGVKQISFPLTMDHPDCKQEDPFRYHNRSLYVHVDFIENQCIDGQLRPVLTHLPIQDAIPPGKASTEFHFDHPVYVPTKDIKTNHIHLWNT